MKIGVAISPVLQKLLEKKPNSLDIDLDYIEVNGEHDLALLERVLAIHPVLLHDISNQFWLNYDNPFDEAAMAKTRSMIELARPPWHSTGIGASAEPQGHTTEFWRGAPSEDLQTREHCLANIVRNGKRLADWLEMPLLLENYNYHPTNAYEYICEPDTYTRLIEEIGCGALIDLAHAQISAFNMGWKNTRSYLKALSLDRVREIHINHPYNDEGKQMLDRHLPLEESDLDLLWWTVNHAPQVEAITLESEPASEEGLRHEISLLRKVAG